MCYVLCIYQLRRRSEVGGSNSITFQPIAHQLSAVVVDLKDWEMGATWASYYVSVQSPLLVTDLSMCSAVAYCKIDASCKKDLRTTPLLYETI